MSFGHSSWIATHLLGEDAARHVVTMRVEDTVFGNTTGPWGGIGGSAMSSFTMTLFTMADGSVAIFADETLFGWAPPGELATEAVAQFPRYRGTQGLETTGLPEFGESE